MIDVSEWLKKLVRDSREIRFLEEIETLARKRSFLNRRVGCTKFETLTVRALGEVFWSISDG